MKNYQKPICTQIEVETEQNLLLISEDSVTLGSSGAGIVIKPNGSMAAWNE